MSFCDASNAARKGTSHCKRETIEVMGLLSARTAPQDANILSSTKYSAQNRRVFSANMVSNPIPVIFYIPSE
jgi:hypothetical protein